MNTERKCMVGHDDDGFGWIIGILIAVLVIALIVTLIVYGGAFIGGFHSIKNYIVAFKHNVFDANRKQPIEA